MSSAEMPPFGGSDKIRPNIPVRCHGCPALYAPISNLIDLNRGKKDMLAVGEDYMKNRDVIREQIGDLPLSDEASAAMESGIPHSIAEALDEFDGAIAGERNTIEVLTDGCGGKLTALAERGDDQLEVVICGSPRAYPNSDVNHAEAYIKRLPR